MRASVESGVGASCAPIVGAGCTPIRGVNGTAPIIGVVGADPRIGVVGGVIRVILGVRDCAGAVCCALAVVVADESSGLARSRLDALRVRTEDFNFTTSASRRLMVSFRPMICSERAWASVLW
jgi:hypothetical protein